MLDRKITNTIKGWRVWFAWRPVRTTDEFIAFFKPVWARKIELDVYVQKEKQYTTVEWQYAPYKDKLSVLESFKAAFSKWKND